MSQEENPAAADCCQAGLYDERGYSKVARDEFLNTRRVAGLTFDTFRPYLMNKEMVLVMFYDPCDPVSQQLKPAFIKESESPSRYGQLFAAVDCSTETALCYREKVKDYSKMTMYTRADFRGQYTDPTEFTQYAKIYMSV